MAVSAISSSSNYPSTSPQAQFRQDFSQLAKSIQSGDLSGAQQSYAALTQLQGGGQGQTSNSSNPLTQALSQIGQALQSGDISSAQQALQTLQQSHGGHHHHHSQPAANSSSDTSASTATPATAGSSGSTSIGITINLSA